MVRTLTVLLVALILLPFVALKYDQPPGEAQWVALSTLFAAAGLIALICFVAGEATGNNS